jgi:hypothetical protein
LFKNREDKVRSKFTVKETVTALASETDSEVLFFHLARALSWAFLDQKKGDRSRYKSRTVNARSAGLLVVSRRVHTVMANSVRGRLERSEKRLLKQFNELGGVKALSRTPTLETLVLTLRDNEQYTRIVYRLVDYLCCAAAEPRATVTVAAATECVMKHPKENRSESAVSKSWELYAPGAALIYACYKVWPELMTCCDRKHRKQPVDVLARRVRASIKKLSKSPTDVRRFIGYAAYAAAVFKKAKMKKPFIGSFAPAKPVAPPLAERTASPRRGT